MPTAYFERFSLDLDPEAVADLTQHGPADDAAEYWSRRTPRPPEITPERLAAELDDFGAWEADDLTDDEANFRRLVWLAAGSIKDEAHAAAQEARHN